MRFKFNKIFFASLLFFLPVQGQTGVRPFKIDATELTQELQKQSHGDGIKLVWWIPNEFWMASSSKPGDMDELITALEPYVFVAVIDGSVSRLGAFSYRPEEEIRKNTKIFDANGSFYLPLDSKMISGDVTNVISMIKPILSNALGEMGKNFVFLVFPKKGKDGKPVVLPTKPGKFRIELGHEDFFYHLPLASISPKLKCKNDSELFPSNFQYCPFHGSALVAQDTSIIGK